MRQLRCADAATTSMALMVKKMGAQLLDIIESWQGLSNVKVALFPPPGETVSHLSVGWDD